jgi:hypothetical protein
MSYFLMFLILLFAMTVDSEHILAGNFAHTHGHFFKTNLENEMTG